MKEEYRLLVERFSFEDVKQAIDDIGKLKILIIGDCIVDEYVYVSFLGKPSKENIISTLYEDIDIFPGGVYASINNLSSFSNQIDYITVIGREYKEYLNESSAKNIQNKWIWSRDIPTTKKTRFVERGDKIKKIFEIYKMNDDLIAEPIESEIHELLDDRLSDYDVVIINDYGHGLFTERLIKILLAKSKFLAINAQINSGNHGFNVVTKYMGATYYCIDLSEARMALNSKYIEIEEIPESLRQITRGRYVTVTLGSQGSISSDGAKAPTFMPAMLEDVVDSMGAGDAYYALSAPILSLSESLELAAFIGNVAGAIEVGIPGLSDSISKKHFLEKLSTFWQRCSSGK